MTDGVTLRTGNGILLGFIKEWPDRGEKKRFRKVKKSF